MKMRRIAEIAFLCTTFGLLVGCDGDEAVTIVKQPTATATSGGPTRTPSPTASPTQVVLPTDTRTVTPRPSATPTVTPVTIPTDTPTVEGVATDTPTATGTPSEDTPTPTETPVSGGLGVRDLFIRRPGSSFNTSALAGFDVSLDPWLPGPLKLEAGTPDASGVASLVLLEDAIVGFPVLDGSVACTKLFAEGSEGTVSCNGGVPQSVSMSQDSNGDQNPGPVIIMTGIGDPSPSGSASFTLMRSTVNLPVGSDPEECAGANYTVIEEGVFTTAQATATIFNPVQGGNALSLTRTGIPFSCDDWANPDGPGKIIGPVLGLDVEPVGDVANLLIISGQVEMEGNGR